MIAIFQSSGRKEIKNKGNRSSIVWSNLVLALSWHAPAQSPKSSQSVSNLVGCCPALLVIKYHPWSSNNFKGH